MILPFSSDKTTFLVRMLLDLYLVDGDNSDFAGRSAWGNGLIYAGWIALGAYDPNVQKVAEAVLAAVSAGVRNPSLDYMSTVYGKIALAGFVTRNMRVAQTCS